jgi:hypothetical protein
MEVSATPKAKSDQDWVSHGSQTKGNSDARGRDCRSTTVERRHANHEDGMFRADIREPSADGGGSGALGTSRGPDTFVETIW